MSNPYANDPSAAGRKYWAGEQPTKSEPMYRVRMSVTRVTEYETFVSASSEEEAREIADSLIPDDCSEVDENTIEWVTSVQAA